MQVQLQRLTIWGEGARERGLKGRFTFKAGAAGLAGGRRLARNSRVSARASFELLKLPEISCECQAMVHASKLQFPASRYSTLYQKASCKPVMASSESFSPRIYNLLHSSGAREEKIAGGKCISSAIVDAKLDRVHQLLEKNVQTKATNWFAV